jgi:hypothetical protein
MAPREREWVLTLIACFLLFALAVACFGYAIPEIVMDGLDR